MASMKGTFGWSGWMSKWYRRACHGMAWERESRLDCCVSRTYMIPVPSEGALMRIGNGSRNRPTTSRSSSPRLRNGAPNTTGWYEGQFWRRHSEIAVRQSWWNLTPCCILYSVMLYMTSSGSLYTRDVPWKLVRFGVGYKGRPRKEASQNSRSSEATGWFQRVVSLNRRVTGGRRPPLTASSTSRSTVWRDIKCGMMWEATKRSISSER